MRQKRPRAVPRSIQLRAVQAAVAARNSAYAPYSEYKVGAAIVKPNHKIITGCNVENASYGLTICAERVAVVRAVAEARRNPEFAFLVVATENGATPCGACLQVLSEFCDDLPILLVDGAGHWIVDTSLRSLLPHGFKSARID
jgi:cytidine deaminase